MPKDAKGHGSNPRGGSYPNIDKNLRGPGKHVGYADGAWRIVKSGPGYQATHQQTGEMLFSGNLGQMSSKLADRAAAAELASGPKSAPAPVHEAMRAAAFQEKDPAKISEKLEKAYRSEHGWSGDVGKHKGG